MHQTHPDTTLCNQVQHRRIRTATDVVDNVRTCFYRSARSHRVVSVYRYQCVELSEDFDGRYYPAHFLSVTNGFCTRTTGLASNIQYARTFLNHILTAGQYFIQ